MNFSPFLKQLFVASAPQFAAFSAGGFVSFPGILFSHLKANDSTIHLDIHTASWIGSTHGLAGALACFMSIFMQYKGRKIAFMLSCLLGFSGWIIIYFARNANALIVAEIIHGMSGTSMLTCSLLTISELLHPKFRIISMNSFFLSQTFGMNMSLLFGTYFSWRTVALIECCPIIVALLICLTWPESPAWLAYKGEFEKCEAAFKWLRGTDADSQKELRELIRAHKEIIAQHKDIKSLKINRNEFCNAWRRISQRDFYLPCLHTFVMICAVYWSGMSVVIIYAMDLLQQVTGSESSASIGVFVIYFIFFIGNGLGLVMLKYFNNKTIIISGGTSSGFFMIAACVVSYLQTIEVLPQESHGCMYCLIGFTVSCSCGVSVSFMSVAAELMPIKHRGVGGAIYIIFVSVLDFTALKLAPYFFLYIKPWGTFLVYAINAFLCTLFIWIYVPETKNKTLQEIEDFYNNGHFAKYNVVDNNVSENIINSNNVD